MILRRKHWAYILSTFLLTGFLSCSDDSSIEELSQTETLTTKTADEYPSADEMRWNATVSSAMNRLWLQTLYSANEFGRREFGCYIYYDKETGIFSVGENISGLLVSGCVGSHGSIYPGVPYDNISVCGFFHTHTPLTYCTTGSRRVGPSAEDIKWANRQNLPCLLYDYSHEIQAGHNINDMASIYGYGPWRRPSI